MTLLFAETLEQLCGYKPDEELSITIDLAKEQHQKLGEFAKVILDRDQVRANEEHQKKCKHFEDADLIITTDKEPEIICIDIKYGGANAMQTFAVMNLIPNAIKISDIYEFTGEEDPFYILKGVIIYWGSHYFAYYRVFIDGEEEWLRVDDQMITKKGDWENIVTECVAGPCTPTLFLYEKYKESVLVPDLKDMEVNFKLKDSKLEELIVTARQSKVEGVYQDSIMKLKRKESDKNEGEDSKMEEDKKGDVNMADDEPDKKGRNTIDKPGEGDDGAEPEPEILVPTIGEDEWNCEECNTINKNNKARCKG
mmetsp:Transcript_6167/g.5763  ORF Transcript_6167/g.5763 Transcript_6167/m.5763 type:complete len:310 (+) Transcript_6167:536-1465(+)